MLLERQASVGGFLRSRRQAIERDAKYLGSYSRIPERVGKPVTQEEISEALDVSRQWYATLEADAARASTALLNRICNVFALGGQQRLDLFQMAITDLGIPDTHGSRVLEALSFQGSALELTISSATEIEATIRRLDQLRTKFMTHNDFALEAVRPRIARSWMRSQGSNVDPGCMAAPLRVRSDSDLFALRERNELLLRAAEPVVRYIVNELEGTGYAVVVTDKDGWVLQLYGDADIRRKLTKLDVLPGGDMSERAAGTNAIGTALADGRPLQLVAAEHFCDAWQDLTCTAAPIRDPQTFAVIGALDITGSYKLIRGHLLAMIMQCALEIEEELAQLSGRSLPAQDLRNANL